MQIKTHRGYVDTEEVDGSSPFRSTSSRIFSFGHKNLARTRESTLLPKFLPAPKSVGGFDWQREAQLMRQHAYLAAMVRLMHDHVGKHSGATRPGSGPTVAAELPDASPWAA